MLLGAEMGWKQEPNPHQALVSFKEPLLVGKVAFAILKLADTEGSAQILVSLTILQLSIQELQTDPGEAQWHAKRWV